MQIDPPVNVPFGGDPNGGAPTGAIYNDTQGFIIPANGEKKRVLFIQLKTEPSRHGGSGSSTITVADRSAMGTVYKGLADGSSMVQIIFMQQTFMEVLWMF